MRDFENGYWYLAELKNFADRLGIPAAKRLRNDELEKAIVVYLRTGSARSPTKRPLRMTGVKDVERGLDVTLRIENYTSNRETKDFIIEQARMMAPDVQRFERVPHGRYINFVADFLETDESATRAEAIAAWAELKKLDVPKDYESCHHPLVCRSRVRMAGVGEGHGLCFSDRGDGDLQPGNSHRQFRALPGRRIRWKPAKPLLVHAGEVILVGKDDRGAHDPVEGAAGRLEDRLDVGEALPRLLLDGTGHNRAGDGIDGGGAGNEHEASRLHGLAVGRRRPRGVRRGHDVTGHGPP